MLDVKVNEKDDVAVIRLADARLQPDNPIGSNDSPFYNLPEACLLAICDNCDFHMLALLSTVCKKFSEFLRVRVFFKYPRFNAETSSLADVQNGLLTAARLVQCVKPKNFYFKMYRNFVSSIDWPKLSLDMVATSSEICLEMDFFKPELLANLQRISGRIKSLHLHRTVYHSDFYQIKNSCAGVSFPEVTNLTISCYAMSCYIPEFSPITIASPKLETITFRKGNIKWKNVILFCELAKQLRTVIFEECCFDQDIGHSDIREVAVLIQKRDKLKPLRMIFGRISVKKPQTLMAPVEEKLCQCLRCPRCKYQRGSPSDLFQCSCKVCQYCELNRVKNKYATQPTIVNSIEESSYEGIKEVRIIYYVILIYSLIYRVLLVCRR